MDASFAITDMDAVELADENAASSMKSAASS